jgi:ribose transport system substrate-binding protein
VVRLVAIAFAAASLAGVTACGGDDDDSGPSTSSSGGGADLAKVRGEVDKYYKGTYEGPPKTAPAHQPGKNVWLISTSQAVGISANAIAGAESAAKSLGWKPTIVDGKADPAVWGNGIRQAIADNADAIFLYIIDCNLVKGPLQQARAAGIEVVAQESLDCNETNPGQKSLFTANPPYVEGPYSQWIQEYGKVQALWAIANADGKANVLYPRTDEIYGFSLIRKGTEQELKQSCPDCKLTYYAFKLADLGGTFQSKSEQALLKNPDTNSMILSVDALGPTGLNAALQSSGRGDSIKVIGSEGDPAIMDIIREGKVGQQAGVGIPPQWEGYAAMDALVRLFAHKPVVGSGIGLQLFDKDHNIPPKGGYAAPIDFVAGYDKAWGVE